MGEAQIERDDISTHSLTRRLTTNQNRLLSWKIYFNSQPHEEADDVATFCKFHNSVISTHSLTRRLTRLEFRGGDTHAFQLTASRGG